MIPDDVRWQDDRPATVTWWRWVRLLIIVAVLLAFAVFASWGLGRLAHIANGG